MDPDVPTVEVAGCRDSHDRLRRLVGSLTAEEIAGSSALRGRSIAALLTHVARNADSVIRRLDGAMRSEVVDQYVGGVDGKFAEIAAGANRPPAEIVRDVIETSHAVDEAFASFPDDCWHRHARATNGEEHAVALLPFRRWRDVELHLVDLGVGYRPQDWPDELVSRCIPGLVADLPRRVDDRAFMAWALLRGPAPIVDGDDLGGWCFSADEAADRTTATS